MQTQTNTSPNKTSSPKTLPEFLATIPDRRRGQGRMHRLQTILLLILMATMSGCYGQRATGDFVRRHHDELIAALKPEKDRLPSYQTIARVMQHLNYKKLSSVFFQWAKTVVPIGDKEWLSIDGKAIRGTVTDAETAQQSYTNLVSLFVQKSKQVLTAGKVANKTNEIPLVAQLVEQLGLTGLVFTADALHCQKATVAAIKASGNDYVIGVKDNQKKLHDQLKKTLKTNLSVAM
jgi:hypothetical protein